MSFHTWLQNLQSALTPSRHERQHKRRDSRRAATHRLNVEVLEDRLTPSFGPAASYAVGANPQAVVTADFNRDGKLDFAVANYDDNSVSVLLGNGDGTFQSVPISATVYGSVSLAVGDFDGDGKLDLATANPGDRDVSVLLGNGDGTFNHSDDFFLGDTGDTYPRSVAVGDFNGDGHLDLGVTANEVYYLNYPNVYVLLGNGDGSFSAPNVTGLGPGHFFSAVAADFNGDGFDDFVTLNADYDEVYVLRGDSSGYLQGPYGFSAGHVPVSVAAGDLNGDGHTDLVTANVYGSSVSVLLGNGAGSFSAAANFATGSNPFAVVLGDFTGNGKVDVATANNGSSNLSVLAGGGDGTLAAAVNSAVGSFPTSVAADDFNGDGWLDAATANSGTGDVSVLINDHGWPPPNVPSITVNDVSVREGNTGTTSATFTLNLSAVSSADVTVHYVTADITAVAGSDYTAASGAVTIPAGQLSRTFTIAVRGDRLPEPNETFAVNLSAPTNATIGDGQGIGTIVDDEPRISISDVSKKEGNGKKTTQFTFTVTLSAAYDQAVTMSFAAVNGTATTSDSDYVAKTGTLTFAPGETTKTITIVVNGDSKKEANETFYLDLFGNSGNSLFTKYRGTGTILNDD